VAIWSGLFTIGTLLYGRMGDSLLLGAVFVISTITLAWVMRNIWPDPVSRP
jgi:hypothetical protein